MKIGDLVECIDSSGCVLTLGKVYAIVATSLYGIEVVNDDGAAWFYGKERFKLLSSSTVSVQATRDNGAVDLWTEEGFCGLPVRILDTKCDKGCGAIGETHDIDCKAFDPFKTVPFG